MKGNMLKYSVKIFKSNNGAMLQDQINKFLEKDGIVCTDIKFNVARLSVPGATEGSTSYHAMLIYYEFVKSDEDKIIDDKLVEFIGD